jgi:hypothetical protein
MKRRRFLTGMAGAALAAPFLPSLNRAAKGQTAAAPPKRLVIFYTNNGCLTNRWFPKNPDGSRLENGPVTAANLAGTTLAGLSNYASKLLFPGGLALFPRGQVSVNGVTYFDPHDQGMGSKLTGSPIDPAGSHWALAPSLDHVAAGLVNRDKATPPLVLSVGNSFANVKGIVSYKAAQTPFSPETRPQNVYNKLTGLFTSGGTPTVADYRVAQGNSILDCVRGDLTALRALNMSRSDQQRLTAWQELLRNVETTMPTVSAECNAANATNLGITASAVQSAGTSFTTGGDMMIKLIALTMMCDANRIFILQWPGFAKFNWDGIVHEYDHHGLSHRNGSAAVGGTCVTNVIESLNQIDNWYAGRYAKLVGQIDSIGEVTATGSTMLDNSMVMWLPELADGNAHNNNNLPIVIAGNAGGYLKKGQAVNLDTRALGAGNSEASCSTNTSVGFNTGTNTGNVPLNKLHVTLLNALGAIDPATNGPFTKFGMADTNKVEDGIKNPGELTALRG